MCHLNAGTSSHLKKDVVMIVPIRDRAIAELKNLTKKNTFWNGWQSRTEHSTRSQFCVLPINKCPIFREWDGLIHKRCIMN